MVICFDSPRKLKQLMENPRIVTTFVPHIDQRMAQVSFPWVILINISASIMITAIRSCLLSLLDLCRVKSHVFRSLARQISSPITNLCLLNKAWEEFSTRAPMYSVNTVGGGGGRTTWYVAKGKCPQFSFVLHFSPEKVCNFMLSQDKWDRDS